MVQKSAKDGKIALTLVRAGKELKVDLPVSANRPLLLAPADGSYPSYFVFGPLAFTEADDLFVAGLSGAHNGGYLAALVSRGSPLITRLGDKQAFPDERLVAVASPFFPHKLAKGYSSPFAEVVKTVNGTAIRNLNHLVEVLRDSKDEFITIEFAGRGGETMVFPRAEMVSATDEILTDNGVRSQGSADTMAIWNKK
jgi:hypothetical protein